MEFKDFNFPSTPHMVGDGVTREDKVINAQELEELLKDDVKIQEKVDGSQVCIFTDSAQEPYFKHRNGQINMPMDEFKKLDEWYAIHREDVTKICEGRYVLVGEWMYWKHQVEYDKLPSFFVVYDMFDLKDEKFLSQNKVAEKLKGTNLYQNPTFFEGKIRDIKNLENMMSGSLFGASKKEGLYIRVDDAEHNLKRVKYVSPEFLDNLKEKEHWKVGKLNHSIDNTESLWKA
jgi:hypothetical protein